MKGEGTFTGWDAVTEAFQFFRTEYLTCGCNRLLTDNLNPLMKNDLPFKPMT